MNSCNDKLSINSFSFFLFLLDKIDMKASIFCDRNGWNPESYHMWKSHGVPKKAWSSIRQELALHNYSKFYERFKDEFVYLKEAQEEYIEMKGAIN